MDQLSLIRKINTIGEKYYSGNEAFDNKHNCYLDECNYWLIKFIENHLGNDYLFYVLTYMHKDGEVGFVNRVSCENRIINDKNKYAYNKEFKKIFEDILENEYLPDIEATNITSMTQNLLENKTGFDIFFQGKNKYNYPILDNSESTESKILFFNLSELNYDPVSKKLIASDFEINELGSRLSIKGTPRQIRNLLGYYKRLEHDFLQEFPDLDFMAHFIRPYFIDFDYNLLFSLVTNKHVNSNFLAFINLIVYKIVGLMATERVKENEALKRKKSFSLTTHGLMTEINTTMRPQLNYIKKQVSELCDPPEKLTESVEELSWQIQNQSNLAGLNSLIDKIDDFEEFNKSGEKYKLVSRNTETIKLSEYITLFNDRHPDLSNIVLFEALKSDLTIKVNGMFFSSILIKLFYDTVFENIIENGVRNENNTVTLTVNNERNIWTFENRMINKQHFVNEKRLRGNLALFKMLIEDTNSGKFIVNGDDYIFKIIINQTML